MEERKATTKHPPSLPHLVQSRWVSASLQQQAHDVGLVLLHRHVKGRLPILQWGEERWNDKKQRKRHRERNINY